MRHSRLAFTANDRCNLKESRSRLYPKGFNLQSSNVRSISTTNCWQQRPQSVEYVPACSSDPFVHPVIQPNYLALEADRDVLLAAMRLGRDILRSPPLKNNIAEERWPGTHPRSDDELLGFARENGSTCFHPIGTCRMGPQAQTNTVVDAELRVHGMQNLRVADASIMPSMPSANTNAGSLMIAEKAADMVLGKSPLPAENYA